MSRKRIAIVGWKTGENSFGATVPYLEFLNQYGQVEILTPKEEMVRDVDLLVLPGGADLNPWSYGRVPGFATSNPDVMKQYFYDNNLKQYIDADVPVFGICLGFQQLASYFGCKLTQNMYHPYSDPRSKKVHSVYVCDGVNDKGHPLVFSEKTINPKTNKEETVFISEKVNSLHHQGVSLKKFKSDELHLTRIDEDLTFVEAFEHKTLQVAGVQWHPKLWGLC